MLLLYRKEAESQKDEGVVSCGYLRWKSSSDMTSGGWPYSSCYLHCPHEERGLSRFSLLISIIHVLWLFLQKHFWLMWMLQPVGHKNLAYTLNSLCSCPLLLKETENHHYFSKSKLLFPPPENLKLFPLCSFKTVAPPTHTFHDFSQNIYWS